MSEITLEHIAGLAWPEKRLGHQVTAVLDRLRHLQSVLTAFSAGTDSTLLAVLAHAALGDRALAVTAVSASLPQADRAAAARLAAAYGFRHAFIETDELKHPAYAANPPNRCYHCKSALFRALRDLAVARGLAHVLDGANVDDAADFRPGRQAARENNVVSPLAEAGFTKADIRLVSGILGLPTAAKPAAACLASRIPYGTPITAMELRRIDAAEDGLRGLGFGQVRVRSHGDLARIELAGPDIPRAARDDMRVRIVQVLQSAGYRYVTLDLRGYRTGSLNEMLNANSRPSMPARG